MPCALTGLRSLFYGGKGGRAECLRPRAARGVEPYGRHRAVLQDRARASHLPCSPDCVWGEPGLRWSQGHSTFHSCLCRVLPDDTRSPALSGGPTLRLLCVLMTQGRVCGDLSPATHGTKSSLHEGSVYVENKGTQFQRPWLGKRLLSVHRPRQRRGREQSRAGAASKGCKLTSLMGSPEHS